MVFWAFFWAWYPIIWCYIDPRVGPSPPIGSFNRHWPTHISTSYMGFPLLMILMLDDSQCGGHSHDSRPRMWLTTHFTDYGSMPSLGPMVYDSMEFIWILLLWNMTSNLKWWILRVFIIFKLCLNVHVTVFF